jgi:hypothetical protein
MSSRLTRMTQCLVNALIRHLGRFRVRHQLAMMISRAAFVARIYSFVKRIEDALLHS